MAAVSPDSTNSIKRGKNSLNLLEISSMNGANLRKERQFYAILGIRYDSVIMIGYILEFSAKHAEGKLAFFILSSAYLVIMSRVMKHLIMTKILDVMSSLLRSDYLLSPLSCCLSGGVAGRGADSPRFECFERESNKRCFICVLISSLCSDD